MNICKANVVARMVRVPELCRNHFHTGTVVNKSYYEILRLPKNATQTEIKEAYYKLSKVYHPDIAKDENSLSMFRSINEAYDTLSNMKLRKDYDTKVSVPGDYDTTKQPFYTSIVKDLKDRGIRGFHDSNRFTKQNFHDRWMDDTYHQRFVEKKHPYPAEHDPNKEPFEVDEYQRFYFLLGVSVCIVGIRYADHNYGIFEPLE